MRGIFVTVFLMGSVAVGIAVGACSDAAPTEPADAGADDDNDQPAAINSGSGVGTGSATGLPCDIQQLLENRCIGCHLIAVPPPLTDYEEVVAPAPSDRSKTMAQKAVERMKSTTAPMPPKPAVAPTAAEIATFEAWVNAGAPKNPDVCTPKPATDGGTTDGGATTNYNTPLVCTSNGWERRAGAHHGSLICPGSTACGSCARGDFIAEDLAPSAIPRKALARSRAAIYASAPCPSTKPRFRSSRKCSPTSTRGWSPPSRTRRRSRSIPTCW